LNPFFQLNVEVSLHHMDAIVARGLATPVAGLLEIAETPALNRSKQRRKSKSPFTPLSPVNPPEKNSVLTVLFCLA
jgi:hypothetical protein